SNPWNPTGSDLVTSYRFSELGQRIDTVDIDNRRLVVALEGTLGDWVWELSALANESTSRILGEGHVSADRIADALNGIDLDGNGLLEQDEFLNLYSPVSNPNSLALTNSLKASSGRRSTSRLRSYALRTFRNLRQMSAGQLLMALGFERRIESIKDLGDPQNLISLIDGLNDPEENKSGPAGVPGPDRRYFGMRVDLPLDQIDAYAYIEPWDVPFALPDAEGFVAALGSQSLNGVFGELRIPLLPELDLQLALRFDDIESFDEGLSPRMALRFGETRRVRTRASWAQSFRAPSPGELFRGPSSKLQGSWDPKRCPQLIEPWLIPELSGGCVTTAFVATVWGNPNLAAEQSESTSVGIEGDIFENHRVGADCWQVDVYDKIVTAQTAWMIRNEDNLPPGTIIRYDPEPGDPPGYPGGIRQVNLLPLNFGRQEVRGCDLDVDTAFIGPADGVLTGQVLATHIGSNRLSRAAGDPLEQLAGAYGYPKNRVNLNLTWSRDRWQAGLYGRWTDGLEEAMGEGEVASHVEWDAQMRFAATRATSVTLGVENLLDEPPPFSASASQGFPVDYYDMRGRFVYLQLNHTIGGRRRASGFGD
ncbi:MAG: TonB-dependent receptor, partial [Gammaproteobacteria bacterium]